MAVLPLPAVQPQHALVDPAAGSNDNSPAEHNQTKLDEVKGDEADAFMSDYAEKQCFLQQVVGETGDPRHAATQRPSQEAQGRQQGTKTTASASTASGSSTSAPTRSLKKEKADDGGEQPFQPRNLFPDADPEIMTDAEMRNKKKNMEQTALAERTGSAFWDQMASMLKANNQEIKDTIDLKLDVKLSNFERNVDNKIAAETEARKADQHRIDGKFDEVLKRLEKLEVGSTAESSR